MQTAQGSRLNALRGAQTFLIQHAHQLPDDVNAMRVRLDATIALIDHNLALQEAHDIGMKIASRHYRALREALLRSHIGPIVSIARLEMPNKPELAPFRRPSGNRAATVLASTADGLAHAAQGFHDDFVSFGLRADFIIRLRTASDDMMEAFGRAMTTKVSRVVATSTIRRELSRARKIVDVISSMMHEVVAGDAALGDGWTSMKRVQNVSRKALTAPHAVAALPGGQLRMLGAGDTTHVEQDTMLEDLRQAS